MININKVEVFVSDYNNKLLKKAKVTLRGEQYTATLKFNSSTSAYVLLDFKPGRYEITATAEGYEPKSKSVFIGNSGVSETFILGTKGMPFFYRGTVEVPFEPIKDSFAVVMHTTVKEPEQLIKGLESKHKVTYISPHKNLQSNGVLLFKYPSRLSEDAKMEIRKAIQRQKEVALATSILKQSEANVSLLTDEIVVKFKGNIEPKEVQRVAREFGLKQLRTIPYAGNGYQFRVVSGKQSDILGVCASLVKMGIVEYAEPNLFHTHEADVIIPTNYLFPEQWDHTILGTPGAWQVLNDHLGAARRFGHPDIVVAVVDSGVNTAHPQFSGTVSNAQPKMFSAFDFANMVANNTSLDGSHGTCCASASTGMTSVSSGSTGVPDGTAGIAGNVRLMGCRQPGWATGLETNYADMYIWIGGFNPNSMLAGFPAQQARGADIITNSFGYSTGAPISGLMKDTFDHLTTYGRNGKGLLLFFSAGNANTQLDVTFARPWGMYKKCMSVSASTLGNDGVTEIKASYSSFGTPVSFCAPSNDNEGHHPPTGYGAFTATILNASAGNDGNTPRNREIQTTLSANAAIGAGSITVASAAGMAVGQAIMIEVPGNALSEAKRISGIVGTTISFTPTLFNAHNSGATVAFGNRDYTNNFGGTSYATPVTAGVSALMLSANQQLTWIEVREILRNTAVKIDAGNTHAVGRWLDVNGLNSGQAGYAGPFFSQFFGYGRINALAAVTASRDYDFGRDIFVRDNMSDIGATTSVPPHWRGVDIWVRNFNDGVAPLNYATDANVNNVHQSPIFGQVNYLNVRFRNRGAINSFPFFIRAYIAHYPGTEFIYPTQFIPTVRPNGTIPNPLTFGTYLIGEQLVNPLNAGTDSSVLLEWPAALIPPKQVNVGGILVNWHPCLLVEVSPHDGFAATGNHVWDDNNLAQKNISINYGDSTDNASFVMLGNEIRNGVKDLRFVITPTGKKPQPYFLFFADEKINAYFLRYAKQNPRIFEIGKYKKVTVAWVKSASKIAFELPNAGLLPMVAGVDPKRMTTEFSLDILQYSGKKITGSYGIEFRKKQ